MNLPMKVGRPKEAFTGYAQTRNGRWSERHLRDKWVALLKTEEPKPVEGATYVPTDRRLCAKLLRTFKPGRLYSVEDMQKRLEVATGKYYSLEDVIHARNALTRQKAIKSAAATKHTTAMAWGLLDDRATCGVSGCARTIDKDSKSGVCRDHIHSRWCKCERCNGGK